MLDLSFFDQIKKPVNPGFFRLDILLFQFYFPVGIGSVGVDGAIVPLVGTA